jgi:ZIP family zinc transporter
VRGRLAWVWLLVPALLLAATVAFLLVGRPLRELTAAAPPVEELAVEAVRFEPGVIALTLRADGSAPVALAQVQVDGAWRDFALTPDRPIERLGTARLDVPYPWVDGETHHLLLLTGTGVGFEHTIEVAAATPAFEARTLATLTLVGLLLGVAPVAIGLMAYPALRRAGPGALRFLLALTVGLLVYLMIDTLGEGLELGAGALGRLRGETLVWVAALFTAAVLLGLGRSGGAAPRGAALAGFIALGIGLHNLGEGLVVGTALATGAAALATYLVVGFVIHNVTEGFGIAAPLTAARPGLGVFAGLAALAGLPAVLGVWAGGQAVSPYWAALCFGIGAGAILQVVIELGSWLLHETDGPAVSRATASGFGLGLAIMYGTALLV